MVGMSRRVSVFPRQFVRFIDGRADREIDIAPLPRSIGLHMSCTAPSIRLRLDYAKKVLEKHRLVLAHFSIIPRIIQDGWCVRNEKGHLELYYEDAEVFGAWFLIVIKSAKWGTECWLVTFFRSKPEHIRNKLKRYRGSVLRNHIGSWEF